MFQVDSSILEAKVAYFYCACVGMIECHVSLDDVRNKLDLHSHVMRIIDNVHPIQLTQSINESLIDDFYQFS